MSSHNRWNFPAERFSRTGLQRLLCQIRLAMAEATQPRRRSGCMKDGPRAVRLEGVSGQGLSASRARVSVAAMVLRDHSERGAIVAFCTPGEPVGEPMRTITTLYCAGMADTP